MGSSQVSARRGAAAASLLVSMVVTGACTAPPDERPAVPDPVGFWRAAPGVDDSPVVGRDRRQGSGPQVIATGTSGRFSMRVQRGVVGVAELDVTTFGSFDGQGGSEVVLDLEALASPLLADPAVERPVAGPSEVVLRRVDGRLFVFTGMQPLPWIELGDGPDPTGATDLASTFDPAGLVDVVGRSSIDVSVDDGGEVDGARVERRSGWLQGSALVDLDDGSGRFSSLAGVVPGALVDRLFRFDLWVGRDDGVARRLVVEWDLDALAELARHIDGTAQGIERIRYRTEVEWFDLGADLRIEAPPRHLVGVIDPGAGRR